MIPRRFFWFFDFTVLSFAFWCAYWSAPRVQTLFTPGGVLASRWVQTHLFPPPTSGPFPPIHEFYWILFATVPGTVLFLELLGSYRRAKQSSARAILSAGVAPFFSLSLIALILVATKEISWSRLVFFLFGAYGAFGLAIFRIGLCFRRRRRQKAGFYAKNVVLIGSSTAIERLSKYFSDYLLRTDYRLFGYLTLAAEQLPNNTENVPWLGTIEKLGDLAVHRPIHEVIIAPSAQNSWHLEKVLSDCDYFRIALRIVPETLLCNAPKDLQWPNYDDPMHLPAIVLKPHEADSDALFVKRIIDLTVSAILLLLLSPVFLVIATAIKVTTPRLAVFYPWRVVGRNGVEFTGYKFTTMVADADERKKHLMKLNEMSGPVFKIKEDPRVTSLGKFLRKYSLNELPQLWSVLKGDMSLVGPRPAGPHELVRYDFWHKRKLSVQSGITCLWQVRGRNLISDFDDWVRMDLEYIDNWSVWLDIKIIFRTAWVVLRGGGS